jgi:Fe-S-cluster containining protein
LNASERDESGVVQRFASAAVRDTLGRSTDVDSCVALAARINVLMNHAIESFRRDGAGIACRAGCSFCCHLRVMVYPHEAIALFRYLSSRMSKEQVDGVRARLFENTTHIRNGAACAFLIDGKCSAYEVRPAACSGHHSLSRERCEQACDSGARSGDGIPALKGLRYVATALDEGMEQALVAAGLSGTLIELQTAVAALIQNPSLIERWRSGREPMRTQSSD